MGGGSMKLRRPEKWKNIDGPALFLRQFKDRTMLQNLDTAGRDKCVG